MATLLWRVAILWLAWEAEIDANGTVIEVGAVLGLERSGGMLGVGKLDVSKALATAAVTVGDDANSRDFSKLFKLASEPLLVNVPAQVADEQVASGALGLSLCLLWCLLWLSFGLALLADLNLWLLFFLFVVIAGSVGVVGIILRMC